MNTINILTHVLSTKDFELDVVSKYSCHECNITGKIIKETDENGLKYLVNKMITKISKTDFFVFEGFYYNYEIPQIGKEFDLLKFCQDYVINIELKSKKSLDDVLYQLKRNQYYLNVIGLEIYSFTYLYEDDVLYKLCDDTLIVCEIEELIELLKGQKGLEVNNINKVFSPMQYLVSPFNTPDRFVLGEYFLNSNQEEYQRSIIKKLKEGMKFLVIEGKAGTGKTLLLYDIAKELKEKNNYGSNELIIVHCGYFNEGHEFLRTFGYNVIEAKNYKSIFTPHKKKIILIDEAQRIFLNQLKDIVKFCNVTNSSIVFSLDPAQILGEREQRDNVVNYIKQLTGVIEYKLSNKIRVNTELAKFIEKMFDTTKRYKCDINSNIEIVHFDNIDDVNQFIEYKKQQEYVFINFTKANNIYLAPFTCFRNAYGNTHKVIGQEFDNVLVTIDRTFYYDDEGKLKSRGWGDNHFLPIEMLFQQVTRVRSKLCIVIYKNPDLFKEILSIFKYEQ